MDKGDGISMPFSGGPEGRAIAAIGVEPARPFAGKFRELAADIKLHHSIFALPWAILATVLAAHRAGGLKVGQLILILICMVSARTVAMVANRLLDAEFDLANPRTAKRAVPSGKLSPGFMWVSLVVSALIFIGSAAVFLVYRNFWPIALSIPVLAFLVGYSLMKRYTRLCHYYLGAALALAPVCAWVAITGTINLPPLLMAGAVLFWTAGFDILYACQDYAFDVEHHLFSVPATVGIVRALWIARFTHLVSLAFMVLLGLTTPELGFYFVCGIAIASVLLVIEHSLVSPTDMSKLTLAFFTLNGVISLTVGGLGLIDICIR